MPTRLEVSPPSGVFITKVDLPCSGAFFTATNETGTTRTLRVSWATSVNVRAQLHGDSTIQDSVTGLWTLDAFKTNLQILTLRKLRRDWVTGAEIKADLISEDDAFQVLQDGEGHTRAQSISPSPTGMEVVDCVTACHVLDHIALWDNCSIGQL